jgi:hypothetical protein
MTKGSRWVGLMGAAMLAASGLAVSVSDGVAPDRSDLIVDQPAAMAVLANALPEVKTFDLHGRVSRVYGPAFAFGADATASADSFLRAHAGVLGVRVGDLEYATVSPESGHTVPLYKDADGSMKFTLVGYEQRRGGVPVYQSAVRALVRNEPGNPLVLVSNATFDLGDFEVDELAIANANFAGAEASARGGIEGMRAGLFQDHAVVIYAGTQQAPRTPVLAVTMVGRTHASTAAEGFDAFRVIADAATGELIHHESIICHGNVTGRVQGMATQGIKSAECNEEALEPMKDLRITSGAATAFTDADGNYAIDTADGAVTISGSPRGRHFRIFNPSTDAPSLTVNATSPGVAPDLIFNQANTSEMRRAEVNAYIHHVIVRDEIVAVSPNYPTISTQTEWRVNVGVSGTCNAFYMPNDSTNYFNAGGGCPNTSYFDIVYHEYGHHLVQTGGSLQGQYGEGMSDVMGVVLSDQPVLAFGFFNNCNEGLRDARTFRSYPCNGGFHDCGQLISGCVWDTRNAMVASGIEGYQDILFRLAVNAVPLHAGQDTIAPDITVDWLTLDDNDGNIGNGTPHYPQIQAGFSPHNMAGPALDLARVDFPDGLPVALRPDTPTTVRVTVTGVAAEPIDGQASLVSKIGSGSEVVTPMTRIGVNEYLATLPGTPCLETLSYAVRASTTGGVVRVPAGSAYFTALSAGDIQNKFSDDFANDAGGWSVSQTQVGRPGGWVRGVPVASSGAPTDDFGTDGSCYLTGNTEGEDVDGQSVRLYSQRLDARGGLVYLSYARWVSNNTGPNPNQDVLQIEVSGDDGVRFQTLERVGPSGPEVGGGWYIKNMLLPAAVKTDRFRVRFTISDATITDSTVEAAIDSVRLFEYGCTTGCAADFNGDGFLDFFDYSEYVACFEGNCPPGKTADFNADGFTDFFDYSDYVTAFEAGC